MINCHNRINKTGGTMQIQLKRVVCCLFVGLFLFFIGLFFFIPRARVVENEESAQEFVSDTESVLPTDDIFEIEMEVIVESGLNFYDEIGPRAQQNETIEQNTQTEQDDNSKIQTEIHPSEENRSINSYYSEQDVIDIAKVLYRECRGEKSRTHQACVVWTILNRVDNSNLSIHQVITAPNQFAYNSNTPVWDNLKELAFDVLERWSQEKNGEENVGRVLPKDYKYFVAGKNGGNIFSKNWEGPYDWNFSLASPYDT